MLTYNQAIQRIKVLALAHKQIRNFYQGNVVDFITEKTTLYPSCFLQDTPGASNVDVTSNSVTYAFSMFLIDLVHVSADTKANEQDVQSDMFSIAADLIAEINYSGYSDWKIASAAPITVVQEEGDDMCAGVMVQLTISTPYDQDICAVPTNSYTFPINDLDMKPVYDIVYTSNGTEGSTLTIPEIVGKKILMMTRESFPQYEVTAFDDNQSTEFLWQDSDAPLVNINLGTPVNPEVGERFFILYRTF